LQAHPIATPTQLGQQIVVGPDRVTVWALLHLFSELQVVPLPLLAAPLLG